MKNRILRMRRYFLFNNISVDYFVNPKHMLQTKRLEYTKNMLKQAVFKPTVHLDMWKVRSLKHTSTTNIPWELQLQSCWAVKTSTTRDRRTSLSAKASLDFPLFTSRQNDLSNAQVLIVDQGSSSSRAAKPPSS